MASLVDAIRSEPPTEHTVQVWGFDPDLDTVGWACIDARYTVPPTGCPELGTVYIGLIRHDAMKRATSIQKVNGMAETLATYANTIFCRFRPSYMEDTHVYVEAQQVYANPDDSRQKVVAQSNDLLRLAQLTGAIQALAHGHARHVSSILPAEWKHQAKKEAMHAAAIKRVGTRASYVYPNQREAAPLRPGIGDLPKIMGHAMDALCLALVGLDRIAAGTR